MEENVEVQMIIKFENQQLTINKQHFDSKIDFDVLHEKFKFFVLDTLKQSMVANVNIHL